MHGTAWSLVPFLIVIPIAVITRQVLPGLLVGLLVGAYMLHPGVLSGIEATIGYIIKEIAIPDNLRLLVFLYGFGAFVGLVRVTGGVSGFAAWIGKRIKGVNGAFAITWVSSLATFMAPDFRIITVAPVMKRVFSRLKVPPKKVAFIIDATATPFTAIVPIGTAFVGYMVGLIGTAGRHQGIGGTPYHLFLWSIPLNFFSFAMIGYALFITFFQKSDEVSGSDKAVQTADDDAPGKIRLRVAPQVAQFETAQELAPGLPGNLRLRRGELIDGRIGSGDTGSGISDGPKGGFNPANDGRSDGTHEEGFPDPIELVSERVKPDVSNLLLPLGSLLAFTLFLTWWDGHFHSPSFWGSLAAANAAKAMLEALLITLVIAFMWFALRRQPINRTLFGFLQGGNEMMAVNVLLILVWSVSAVSTQLGFVTYTQRVIGGIVPASLIAPALFIFGCAISYVIGSSFGTWGMLLPLGFSLAASTHASLALIAGAVFASGTFGGFVSPLSDNTVAMATVMKLPVMSYAQYKLKAGLLMAVLCTVIYGVVGFVMH